MRKLMLLFFPILLASCHEPQSSSKQESKHLADSFIRPHEAPRKDTVQKVVHEKVFPFNKATKIELVSYERQKAGQQENLIVDGKFRITNIQERITLSEAQANDLYELIYQKADGLNTPADCYIPHHSILFYEHGKVISFLEICFECKRANTTMGFDEIWFDSQRFLSLERFFCKCGLRKHLMSCTPK